MPANLVFRRKIWGARDNGIPPRSTPVDPSYMCDINRISHRHNTRQSDSAYVVPRITGQGSKSFKFNGSKLLNELPTNVKHVQQKIRFKKECRALLMTRMKEKEEMNVVP